MRNEYKTGLFDASAKTENGVSLNDYLETGPALLPELKVFRYSFSEAMPIFFNRFKSDFILV